MRVNRYSSIAIALCIVVGIAGYLYLSPQTPEARTIVLTEDGFVPNEISIPRGSTVTFTNTLEKQYWPASNLHPDHSIYPEFDPKRPLSPEEEWSFTFDKEGTWRFHDHLRSYYTGVIYVRD